MLKCIGHKPIEHKVNRIKYIINHTLKIILDLQSIKNKKVIFKYVFKKDYKN